MTATATLLPPPPAPPGARARTPPRRPAPATLLPPRRPELVIHLGMVEDPLTGECFKVGPEESFLLLGLDGRRTAAALAAEFEGRFGSPLPESDLQEFLGLVHDCGFIRREADAFPPTGRTPVEEPTTEQSGAPPTPAEAATVVAPRDSKPKPDASPADARLPARRSDLIVKPSGDAG